MEDTIVHLGLIGGIGVAATIVYYQRLAAARRRTQEPVPSISSFGHFFVRILLDPERSTRFSVSSVQIDPHGSVKMIGIQLYALL